VQDLAKGLAKMQALLQAPRRRRSGSDHGNLGAFSLLGDHHRESTLPQKGSLRIRDESPSPTLVSQK
jgi:hypothetical protein